MTRYTNKFATWYKKTTAPNLNNLPNWFVIVFPPLLAVLATCYLITSELSGTSSGILWQVFQGTTDPNLISGIPRAIRSDEWLVQQSWVVSQFMHSFPTVNPHFPGGMDMTVFNDLPSLDWSIVFRPHFWGYLIFGLNTGISWYWWVPALLLFVFCYLFVVSFLPNRPMTAIIISITTLGTPFIQWWYQPTTTLSVTWVLMTLTSLNWVIKTQSRAAKILWASMFFYFSLTLAFEIYIPFIIPALLIVLTVGCGILLQHKFETRCLVKQILKRLLPLLIAAAAAFLVTAVWVATRLHTILAILNTAYPGRRIVLTGSGISDPSGRLVSLFGAPWSGVYKYSSSSPFGANASEASSAFPFVLVVIPAILILLWNIYRTRKTIEWRLLSGLLATAIFVLFLYLPGWDFLAQFLGLSMVPPARAKIAFVMLFPIVATLLIETLSRRSIFKTVKYSITTLLTCLLLYVPLVIALHFKTDYWNTLDDSWKYSLILFIIGATIIFELRLNTVGLLALLVSTMIVSWGVNPVYKGLYNLNSLNISHKVVETDSKNPGIWIGVGSWISAAVLTQIPVQSYSGVQSYPMYNVWNRLDPANKYEQAWNRLGHTRFNVGKGETVISNPQPDVISVVFDPCNLQSIPNSTYHILSEVELENECLVLESEVKEPNVKFWIYEIK